MCFSMNSNHSGLLSLVGLQHIHALLNHSDPGRDYFVPNSNTADCMKAAGLVCDK